MRYVIPMILITFCLGSNYAADVGGPVPTPKNLVWVDYGPAGKVLTTPDAPPPVVYANMLTVVSTMRVQECDGGRCRIVTYRWQQYADHPGVVYLYRDGVQVGGWRPKQRIYQALVGGQWFAPSSPPVAVPQ